MPKGMVGQCVDGEVATGEVLLQRNPVFDHRVPHLAFQPDQLSDTPVLSIQEVETSYYLRMRVLDRPGVLADITRILADCRISIEAMVQKEPAKGESQVDIVMLTHRALEKDVDEAMAKMERLPTMAGKIVRMRMEELL
jgi:homoserine dehydrogenase